MISAVNATEIDNNDTIAADYDSAAIGNSSGENSYHSNITHSFDELADEINKTPENQTLVLDRDYQYVNGSYSGIVISKSITIDGAGHTLDGKKSTRIFNVTADNVILKNIKFINANALGSYFTYYGGGAIYWNGTNGTLENCTFTDNTAVGVDYDPYDRDEEITSENGITMVVHYERPMGRTINQGGAITWAGENGTVINCIFNRNNVAYPDNGGAIFWKGKKGKIINSEFYDNGAYRGSAVYWSGADGSVFSSIFSNSGICDSGIFWVGENGTVRNSILLSKDNGYVISQYSSKVDADYNFWGDTIENPNQSKKIDGLNNWIVLNLTSDKELVMKGEEFTVSYDLTSLTDKNSQLSKYEGLSDKSRQIKYVAYETSFIKLSYEKNSLSINLTPIGFFDELAEIINNASEGSIILLDKDYLYLNGSNKGILISKPVTIDGLCHTLDGRHLSRMFNVTSDGVTIRNINFVNGNAYGRYFDIAGGGAVYWYGANGLIENCNFTNNTGWGIEDDPFDKEETYVDENGTVWHTYRVRPMGCKINEGGAIVWTGTDGIVSKCIFTGNSVGYPNSGGAVCWRGVNGKIMDCEFYRNDAWCGSAIVWNGDNGAIFRSVVANSTFFDGGIYWFGTNGTIRDSILLASADSNRWALRSSQVLVDADYNFWGDTIENPNHAGKVSNINNWILMKFTHNGEFVNKGQKILIEGELTNLMDKNGNIIKYASSIKKSFKKWYTATESGFLNIDFKDNIITVKIDSRDAIKSKNLNTYYSSKISFKVTVSDINGKVKGKYVKFTLNKKTHKVKTDKNGVATLKLKLKPGKYTVYASYGNAKAKNKITVKTVLITKNVNVKAKKTGKFTVKVLNSKGKAYAKQTVKIKFKGKNYKLKTNKKGIATFKVSKNLKAGKYTIKTTYNGLTNSNKIIVKK